MDSMQDFWWSFGIYIFIILVMIVYCITNKLPPERITKMMRYPSVVWVFVVFLWVIRLPLWTGILYSAITSVTFWFLLPMYTKSFKTMGEVTGKAILKHRQEKNNDKEDDKGIQ